MSEIIKDSWVIKIAGEIQGYYDTYHQAAEELYSLGYVDRAAFVGTFTNGFVKAEIEPNKKER